MQWRRWQIGRGKPSAERESGDVAAVLSCDCGARWTCQRERRGRVERCPRCGVEQFLLAASPLPPALPTRKQAAIDWEPQSPHAAKAESPGRAEPSTGPASKLAQQPQDHAPAPAERPDAGQSDAGSRRPIEEHWVEDDATARARWSVWSVRLIAAALAVLVGLTAWLSWEGYRRRTAAAVLEQATTRGTAALVEGDYLQAAAELERAAKAAAALPGDSAAERRATQLYLEAQAWSRLAATDLGDFWLSRAQPDAAANQAAWPDEFQRLFAGRVVVFDAWLRREYDPDAAQRLAAPADRPLLQMDWATLGPSARLQVTLSDDPCFAAVRPGQPQRFIFAVKLAGLRRREEVWTADTVPGSAVLLTQPEPLVRCGLPLDEDLRAQLAEQFKREAGS
ncbi:MAG: hypothetical protein K1X74_14970 [Pirellulales bacterium]|nr:hypothetical protein [Pirellulales bacterium]